MSIASSNAKKPLRVVSKLDMAAATTPIKIEGLWRRMRRTTGQLLRSQQARGRRGAPVADVACGRSLQTQHMRQLACVVKKRRAAHDRNEPANRAGAVPDGAPLPLEAVVEQHPREAAERRGEVRVDDGDGGLDVGRECRAAVEAQPAASSNHSRISSGTRESVVAETRERETHPTQSKIVP